MKSDAKTKYADIIRLPHHQSVTRLPMSLHDRAAQFAPFAALSGYEDMVAEESRITDREIELSEGEIEQLNHIICAIQNQLDNGAQPIVTVIYFIPDAYKEGGRYKRLTGTIKKVDSVSKALIFYGSDNTEDKRVLPISISIEKIISITLNNPNQNSHYTTY